ncbi:hypothetical protein ACS0TY_030775 [Phlomoides rotata]
MHAMLLVKPQPMNEDLTDPRWQPFQVPITDKGRYRNWKGQIAVNVLGVCDMDMQFVYVLTGWEGSAADSRVLRDAINRQNGLKVPISNYYLCDNGYANCEDFLTPYKGVRYHLNEWTSRSPQTPHEYFNMKHTRAQNVIERTFGLLKMRWGILRSPSWYPIKTTNQIIMACCLLHNYIRKEMVFDPLKVGVDDYLSNQPVEENGFRAGFQRELEKGMRKIMPGIDIIANPHINSKIHVWKKDYGVLSDLLSKSGIGWNSTNSMIEIEDEGVWDSCRWADPFVKGLRYKT